MRPLPYLWLRSLVALAIVISGDLWGQKPEYNMLGSESFKKWKEGEREGEEERKNHESNH